MLSAERSLRCLVVAAVLQVVLPRSRAEGSASYKFQSWQEDDGRIRVDSQYGTLEDTLPGETKVSLLGVIDAISGATPTGELTPDPGTSTLPLTHIEDRRKAWNFGASHTFAPVTASVGFANSRESDYVSNGWSLNTATDFNQKNTSLLVGLAGTSDKVKVFYQTPWAKKRSESGIVGLNQLLDPETSISVNLGYARDSGYLNDPYRLIEKHIDVGGGLTLLRGFGENRPDSRDRWTLEASVNRSIKPADAAIEASYRFYHDTFGIDSHTLSLEWFQKFFDGRVVVRPLVRYYQQNSANFYRLTLDGTAITPTLAPNPSGPFYSADYRLARMRTWDLGIKVVINAIPDRLSVDVAYDRYTMHGLDGITSQAAFPQANIFTIGASLKW